MKLVAAHRVSTHDSPASRSGPLLLPLVKPGSGLSLLRSDLLSARQTAGPAAYHTSIAWCARLVVVG